jgi:hypothetical protein
MKKIISLTTIVFCLSCNHTVETTSQNQLINSQKSCKIEWVGAVGCNNIFLITLEDSTTVLYSTYMNGEASSMTKIK